MTTAVQHRRGTTAEHSTFTGLEGEVTIDTTKDTAVIHDGALAGGYPLAKENLANADPTSLGSLTGASTAADDQFLVYDTSIGNMKKISRAELNNAMTLEALDTVDINGGTIDGTTIGATTASTGRFTTLNTTGNVTLGDASTDTVQVNGYMGVRATPAPYYGIALGNASTITGDVSPRGISSSAVYGSDATGTAAALFGQVRTTAAAYTMANAVGLRLGDVSKGAGSTITSQHGVYIEDQTQGTNNYGITSLVSSGTGKWNIYASGTAANYFAGNTYIGTASPSIARRLNVYSTQQTLALFEGSGATTQIDLKNSVNQISIVSSSSDLYFYVNSGERLRITSTGNVGIGTSSPSSKLHLSGAATVDAKLTLTQTTAGLTGTLQQGATSLTLSASGAQAITLDTNGAERLRIDSSGNLGLGVTPSAWAGLVGFQIGQAASFAGHKTLPVAYSTANAYYDGGAWRYITSSYAVSAVVDANNGSFYWRTAPSGTAGDPITLTQAMTLDASGRLGIGTSSPGHPLTVNANPGAAGVPVAWLHNSGNVADYDGVVISSVNDGSDAEVLHVRTNNTTYNNGTSLMLVRGDGNVGIGTSSPANPLTVGGSIRGTVLINGTNGASPYLALDHTATTNGRRYIIYSGGINASEFNIYDATASTNRVTLDAAGNLGLGVTPSAWTNSFGVIQGLGGWSVSSNGVNSNSADFASNAYRTGGVDSFVYIGTSNATRYKQFAGAHQWFNAPSGTAGTAITFTQAMTLTAGGDLLVGKTTLDVGISGIEAQSDGSLYVTKNISSGGQVAIFNRLTSDGTIVSLRKDGTTVGSIGTEGGDLIIGTGDTGVQFGDGGDYIRPWNTSTNANRDAAIDLGVSTSRFKDLYLSGGVYVGGTGAANHLDDYEEGTWTPVIEGLTTAGTGTYSTQHGVYTKVGNLVTISLYLNWTAHTGSGSMIVTGVPFSAALAGTINLQAGGTYASAFNAGTGATQLIAYVSGGTSVLFRGFVNAGTRTEPQVQASGAVGVTISYRI